MRRITIMINSTRVSDPAVIFHHSWGFSSIVSGLIPAGIPLGPDKAEPVAGIYVLLVEARSTCVDPEPLFSG